MLNATTSFHGPLTRLITTGLLLGALGTAVAQTPPVPPTPVADPAGRATPPVAPPDAGPRGVGPDGRPLPSGAPPRPPVPPVAAGAAPGVRPPVVARPDAPAVPRTPQTDQAAPPPPLPPAPAAR